MSGDNENLSDQNKLIPLLIDVSARIKHLEFLDNEVSENSKHITNVGNTVINIKDKVDRILGVIGKLSSSIGTISANKENINKLEISLSKLADDLKQLIVASTQNADEQSEELRNAVDDIDKEIRKTIEELKEDIASLTTVVAVMNEANKGPGSHDLNRNIDILKMEMNGKINGINIKLKAIVDKMAESKSDKLQIRLALLGAVLSIIGSVIVWLITK